MAIPWFLSPFDLNDVISISADATKLGVYNTNPQATLDISGGLHVSQDATAANMTTSNVTSVNVTAVNEVIAGSNLVSYGDTLTPHVTCSGWLGMLDTDFTQPCPITHPLYEAFLASHSGPGGAIHSSWISTSTTWETIMSDLISSAEAGVGVGEALLALWDLLHGTGAPSSPLTALEAALNDALQNLNDPTSSNIKLRVGWENVINKPWASRGTGANQDIGLSNVCFSGGLYHIAPTALTTDSDNNTIFYASPPSTFKVIDENQNAWLTNVGCSNIGHSQGCNAIAFRENTVTILNSNTSFAVSTSNLTVAFSNITSGGVAWGSNTLVLDGRTGNVTTNGVVLCGNLTTEQWISPSTGGNITFNAGVALQHKYQLRQPDPTASTASYLSQSDTNLAWKTQVSQSNWGACNGIPPQVSQVNVDNTGCLTVRSNIAMGTPLLLRSLLPPSLDGYPQEGQLTLDNNNLRYITRTSPYTGCNIDVTNFSVNSNGTFLLSTPSPKIYGNFESITVPNPANPLTNITLSNFARLTASFSNGLTFGAGLSNAPLSTNASRDLFTVSRLGELSTYDTNGNAQLSINSNGEVQKADLVLKTDGSIVTTGQQVLVDATGTIRRQATSLGVTSGLTISPSGYLTIGKFMVTNSGDLYMNGRLVLDKFGNLRNVTVDNSVMLKDPNWTQVASAAYEALSFT